VGLPQGAPSAPDSPFSLSPVLEVTEVNCEMPEEVSLKLRYHVGMRSSCAVDVVAHAAAQLEVKL